MLSSSVWDPEPLPSAIRSHLPPIRWVSDQRGGLSCCSRRGGQQSSSIKPVRGRIRCLPPRKSARHPPSRACGKPEHLCIHLAGVKREALHPVPKWGHNAFFASSHRGVQRDTLHPQPNSGKDAFFTSNQQTGPERCPQAKPKVGWDAFSTYIEPRVLNDALQSTAVDRNNAHSTASQGKVDPNAFQSAIITTEVSERESPVHSWEGSRSPTREEAVESASTNTLPCTCHQRKATLSQLQLMKSLVKDKLL